SLVPSQTELLYHLGLEQEVIGITKFCIHPDEWFRTKTRVGGTKQLNRDIIKQLNPDLIIANKEENVKEQIEELSGGEKGFPVWISDVNNLADAYEMIEQIGLITGKSQQANEVTAQIKENFSLLPIHHSPLTCCYLIWKEPFMTVGGDTFIHSMLQVAGFDNIFKNRTRYPEVTIDAIAAANPALLFLSSEPYPFQQKHVDELQAGLPNTKIVLVDGELFSWYGSRLIQAPGYFEKLREKLEDNR
ncbi:MAG: helical backbone metal receptor, partial [Chitinophagaceae bacterium]